MTSPTAPLQLDIREILSLLPHRYPFLLVDRIDELVPKVYVKAHKCVSFNEPFFQGHFPGLPVMPGVLIIEAMAQAGGFMMLRDPNMSNAERENTIFLFTGIDQVHFRRPVYPGDRLDLECRLERHRLKLWKISAHASVDGNLVAEAMLTAALTRRNEL